MGLGEGQGEGSGASDFHHGLFGCLGNPKNCEFYLNFLLGKPTVKVHYSRITELFYFDI